MYPYPVHHPYDQYSMVDLDAVDAEEWPEFGGVRGSVCIMEPGDLLFVPQFWCAVAQLHEAWRMLSTVCAAMPSRCRYKYNFWMCRFAHVQFLDQDNTDLTFYVHPGFAACRCC